MPVTTGHLTGASVAVAFLALAVPAAAFDSLPLPSPHDEITDAAARQAGWPGGHGILREAVRAPDLDEMRLEPTTDNPARIDARSDYDPAHHCDRVPPQGDAEAFAAAIQYIQERRAHARAHAGEPEEAVPALGQALHAAQDCFSHSDYVDLDSAQQAAFRDAVTGGPARPSVRLTAFSPGTPEPGVPADPYPHDQFAKDSPDKNDESSTPIGNRTKHELARDAAIEVSAEILAEFLAHLSPEDQRRLEAYGGRDALGLPSLSPFVGAAVLAVVACRLAKR